jgi:hypothetical protein
MPIDPVKIPQNVYIEDRVVGPLSLRQIIIMVLGGGFSYALYAMWDKTHGSVSIPMAVVLWIPAAVAAAFALVKINDLSLLRICFLLLEKLNKPSVRTWVPRSGISINIRTTPKKEEAKKEEAKRTDARSEIRSLSSVMDRGIPTSITEQTEPQLPSPAPAPVAQTTVVNEDIQGSALPKFPVNPERIKTDSSLSLPPMSDLSVFRDVLPPNA